MRTAGALHLHLRAGLRTAESHRCECLQMRGRQLATVLGAEVGSEGVDHSGQPDHLTFPQEMAKPSIRPLMRRVA